MHYIRSAEILLSLTLVTNTYNQWILDSGARDLDMAIQNYAMFQHHDAITGTSTESTMDDYGSRLLKASRLAQNVIVNAVRCVANVSKPLENLEEWEHTRDLSRLKMLFNYGSRNSERIVVFNSLTVKRSEIIFLVVGNPSVKVKDAQDQVVLSQIVPLCDGGNFTLAFMANVPPMSVASFIIYRIHEGPK